MSEWTTENVRQRVISSFRVTKPEYLGVDSWGSAFDRWLAAHDAEVRAKALEDAADVALLDRIGGFRWIADAVAAWLRVRARAERGQ